MYGRNKIGTCVLYKKKKEKNNKGKMILRAGSEENIDRHNAKGLNTVANFREHFSLKVILFYAT